MSDSNAYHKEVVLSFNLKDQGLRKLLSVKERSNGDLLIMPKYAENYRNAGDKIDDSVKIKQQKYSIHCSNNSKEFNVCMHNLELSNGRTIRTSNYTKAIKSNNNKLTALFFARAPDISISRYKLNNKDQPHAYCLDNYDHLANTVYYGVFISPNTRKTFLSFQQGEQNYQVFKFSNFTILVVWTYQFIPSHSSGAKIHNLSVDDEEFNLAIGSKIFKTTDGFNGFEAKKFSLLCFDNLKQELFSTLIRNKDLGRDGYFLFNSPFRKTPYSFKINGK